MKQHITVKQLNELSEGGHKKLYQWLKSENIESILLDLKVVKPLLSIGQMIEFLPKDILQGITLWKEGWMIVCNNFKGSKEPIPELADALWEVVKEVLNED